jgi:hypothetical protein
MNMNKYKFHLLVVSYLLLFVGSSISEAQIVKSTGKYKTPGVTIEFIGNVNIPFAHLYGKISDFFAYKNYGVNFGFGAQTNVKIHADKKGKMRPYFTFGYALFTGTDNSTAYIGPNITTSYPPVDSQFSTKPGKSKMFIHDFSGGAGFEYAFVNKTRWTPFLGADLALHVLFGTYRQTPSGESQVSFTIKQATRAGFSLGGGVQGRLGKIGGLVFTMRYAFSNVLGKSSRRTNEENKMELLDKAATDLNPALDRSRHIDYLQFGIGGVFFIGRR